MENTYPKLVEAQMLTNNMLCLSFENGKTRYLRSHLLEDIVESYSLEKGKSRKTMLFGTPYLSSYGSKYEIKNDGTLVLNDKDTYTARELWEDSRDHIYG